MLRVAALGACLLACACATKDHQAASGLSPADAVVAYQFCIGAEAGAGRKPEAAAAACEPERRVLAATSAKASSAWVLAMAETR